MPMLYITRTPATDSLLDTKRNTYADPPARSQCVLVDIGGREGLLRKSRIAEIISTWPRNPYSTTPIHVITDKGGYIGRYGALDDLTDADLARII